MNESSKIINENIIKKQNKKSSHSIGERKIKRFKELLQDILLENLDRPKNDLSIIINNSGIEKESNNPKNKTLNNKKNKKVIKSLKSDSNLKK